MMHSLKSPMVFKISKTGLTYLSLAEVAKTTALYDAIDIIRT